MKILVLDDHRGFREELTAILARHGHDASGAATADEAVPLAESGEFDFVLVDYQMPEHDGLWFMQNARLPKHTKALLVTAHVNRAVISRAFEVGARGYLIKPFDEADLLRNLAYHTRKPEASLRA